MGLGNYAGALLGGLSGDNQYSNNALSPYLAEQMRQAQMQQMVQAQFEAAMAAGSPNVAANPVLLLLESK